MKLYIILAIVNFLAAIGGIAQLYFDIPVFILSSQLTKYLLAANIISFVLMLISIWAKVANEKS